MHRTDRKWYSGLTIAKVKYETEYWMHFIIVKIKLLQMKLYNKTTLLMAYNITYCNNKF